MGIELERIKNMIERELSRSWENPERFGEAYRLRDTVDVMEQMESLTDEQRASLAWEVQAGVWGDDSPYHSYFYH